MREIPPGYRLYWPVMARLSDSFRPAGGGLNFRCPFGDRHKNNDAHPSAWVKVGGRGELVAGCNGCRATWREFVAFVGLPAGAWWPNQGAKRMDYPKPRPVAEYPYHDAEGKVVAVKVRLEPGVEGRPKSFVWRRPLPPAMAKCFADEIKGRPCWVSGPGSLDAGWFGPDKERGGVLYFGCTVNRTDHKAFELPKVSPGLYRLPWVVKAGERSVFVCEGEKDADRLIGCGFIATCSANGSKWDWTDGGWLCERNVVIVPDCDDPGVRYGLDVAASLIAFGAKSVRWMNLEGEVPGFDVSDWLSGMDKEAARKAVESAVRSLPAVPISQLGVRTVRTEKGRAA